jgi:hypothetical protein
MRLHAEQTSSSRRGTQRPVPLGRVYGTHSRACLRIPAHAGACRGKRRVHTRHTQPAGLRTAEGEKTGCASNTCGMQAKVKQAHNNSKVARLQALQHTACSLSSNGAATEARPQHGRPLPPSTPQAPSLRLDAVTPHTAMHPPGRSCSQERASSPEAAAAAASTTNRQRQQRQHQPTTTSDRHCPHPAGLIACAHACARAHRRTRARQTP